MKSRTVKYLRVVQAEYTSGYKIRLTFNNEKVRVVNFGPFLAKARNPDTTDYRDLKKFKSFHIQDGDLMWGDFDMIFPITDLYQGTILKGEPPTSAHFVLNQTAFPATSVSRRRTKPVSYKKIETRVRIEKKP